jgi:hypothetical protein
MNHRDAEHIVEKRDAAEPREDAPNRTARPLGTQQRRNRRSERYPQEQLRRRVLALIE